MVCSAGIPGGRRIGVGTPATGNTTPRLSIQDPAASRLLPMDSGCPESDWRSLRQRSVIVSSSLAPDAQGVVAGRTDRVVGGAAVSASANDSCSNSGSTARSMKVRIPGCAAPPDALRDGLPRYRDGNRSAAVGRTRSRAVVPSSATRSPRTMATGTPPSLPLARSAAAAIRRRRRCR